MGRQICHTHIHFLCINKRHAVVVAQDNEGVRVASCIKADVLIFVLQYVREKVERPFFYPPIMATPVSASRRFEFVIRRTFWFPMVKIIIWNTFVYFANISFLFLAILFAFPLAETRLHLFFHFLGLAGTLWILLRWNAIRYTITNTKIIMERGILNIDRDTFLFRNIECLKLHKGILGRICFFGTIEMYAPTLQEHVFLRNVSNARKYAKLIQKSIAQSQGNRIVYPSQYEQKRNIRDRESIKTAKGNIF